MDAIDIIEIITFVIKIFLECTQKKRKKYKELRALILTMKQKSWFLFSFPSGIHPFRSEVARIR